MDKAAPLNICLTASGIGILQFPSSETDFKSSPHEMVKMELLESFVLLYFPKTF